MSREKKKKSYLKQKWILLKWHLRCKFRFLKNTVFFIFIKKNKRWLVFAPAAIVTVQLWVMTSKRDKWRTKSETLQLENVHLVNANIGRNIGMDDFDWAWYEKTKGKDSIRITGMNEAYELAYGLDRYKSLGKTNFALVPYEAAVVFEDMDRKVFETGEPQDGIEPWIFPDSTRMLLYTHKWRSKHFKNKMYGVSVPLRLFVKVIDEQGKLEVIELVTEDNNSIQDTIIISK